jgi:cytochrome P450
MEAVITPDQLSAQDLMADHYPVYRELRERSPFNYVDLPAGLIPGINEPLRAWAFLKYDDVYNALRDPETFSSVRAPAWSKAWPPLVLLEDDPPRHTRFRRLVNQAFTMRRIQALTPWIVSVADELLDTIGPAEADVVQSYTIPLPMKMIARLLGIPGEEYVTFRSWSRAFLATASMDHSERRPGD